MEKNTQGQIQMLLFMLTATLVSKKFQQSEWVYYQLEQRFQILNQNGTAWICDLV